MNAPFPAPQTIERHKFSIEDALDMTAHGLIPKRAVLLDGEIYDMSSDGFRHSNVTQLLGQYINVTLYGLPYFVAVQNTLRLSKHNGPSPDIYVLAGKLPEEDVPADRILLVIEVADTSLDDDLTDSASRYARHGVRDFWVIDVKKRVIHVHRNPRDGAYPPPEKIEAGAKLQALLIPKLTVTLDEIAPGS